MQSFNAMKNRRTKLYLADADQAFLQKVRAVVEKHLEDDSFNGKTLSREVGLSYSQIHRKLKALAQPPVRQFIRTIRLRRACELLQRGALPVTEIAYRAGFRNPAYFSKCFREALGCTPRQFRRQKKRCNISDTHSAETGGMFESIKAKTAERFPPPYSTSAANTCRSFIG